MGAYTFEYGNNEFELTIDRGRILGEVRATETPKLRDVRKTVSDAIADPIGTPPLKSLVTPGEKITVIVGDITRLWVGTDQFMPVILETLNEAGIRDEDITILIGNGDHRKHTEQEKELIVGADVYRRVSVKNHYARKRDELAELGVTSRGTPISVNRRVMEADKVIITGGIVYHFLNGFGGGAKGLSIGVGGYDTIQRNHRLALADNPLDGLNPKVASGVTVGNPLYEDLLEVMRAAKANFALNTVINHRKEIVAVVAGEPVQVHDKGCEIAKSVFGTPLPRKADMAVVSAMGYPEDIDLYQTYKTLDNTTRAVEPGGVIVLFSECREGMGNADFEHVIVNFQDNASRANFIKDNCTIGGLMGFGEVLWAERYKIVLYSSMPDSAFATSGFITARAPEEALRKGYELACDNPTIWVMPHGSVTFPLVGGDQV